jgi:hypothetical protein
MALSIIRECFAVVAPCGLFRNYCNCLWSSLPPFCCSELLSVGMGIFFCCMSCFFGDQFGFVLGTIQSVGKCKVILFYSNPSTLNTSSSSEALEVLADPVIATASQVVYPGNTVTLRGFDFIPNHQTCTCSVCGLNSVSCFIISNDTISFTIGQSFEPGNCIVQVTFANVTSLQIREAQTLILRIRFILYEFIQDRK